MSHALSINLIRPGQDDVDITNDSMKTLFETIAEYLESEGLGKINRLDITVWMEGDEDETA